MELQPPELPRAQAIAASFVHASAVAVSLIKRAVAAGDDLATRGEGWSPETVAGHALPALKAQYHALERSGDVFSRDPV